MLCEMIRERSIDILLSLLMISQRLHLPQERRERLRQETRAGPIVRRFLLLVSFGSIRTAQLDRQATVHAVPTPTSRPSWNARLTGKARGFGLFLRLIYNIFPLAVSALKAGR